MFSKLKQWIEKNEEEIGILGDSSMFSVSVENENEFKVFLRLCLNFKSYKYYDYF
jgi:hypothetical protein